MDIILTVDYEIFGNGTGNCESCRVAPARRMAVIAKENNIPITFFVDVAELLRKEQFVQNAKKNSFQDEIDKTKRCLEETKQQLRLLLRSGHDIQLHLHTQWFRAQKEGGWNVQRKDWSIGEVAKGSPEMARDWIIQGKEYLENIFISEEQDYECQVFRAGGWAIQPSKEVVSILKDTGFKIDSSVVPGMRKNNKHHRINFKTNFEQSDYWYVGKSIQDQANDSGLLEVPIASKKTRVWKRLYRENLFSRIIGSGHPDDCNGSSFSENDSTLFTKLEKLLSVEYHAVDFCHYYTSSLIKFLRERKKKNFNTTVLIGHTKDFVSPDRFRNFLTKSLGNGYTFTTFQKFLGEVS